MFKKLATFGLRFLPLLILIAIIIYLGFANSVSEVYLELVSTQIRFQLRDDFDENLIGQLEVDSLQIRNFNARIESASVVDWPGGPAASALTDLNIRKADPADISEIHFQAPAGRTFYLKWIKAPLHSTVKLQKEENALRVEIADSMRDTKGVLSVDEGKPFTFSGRNLKIADFETYSDYDRLTLSTDEDIRFSANDDDVQMIYHGKFPGSRPAEILQNLYVDNLSFVEIDRRKKMNAENSTIREGDIQIAGVDFFGKRFLLKEVKLDRQEFLDIADGDLYFINALRLTDQGFQISLYCEAATGLAKGKRVRLLRSIFPSMLDFIVAEPSKKTFWTVLLFVLTQFSLLRKTIRSHFSRDKSNP